MGDVHGTLRVLTPTISAFVSPCPAAVCSPWSVTTEPKWTWTLWPCHISLLLLRDSMLAQEQFSSPALPEILNFLEDLTD